MTTPSFKVKAKWNCTEYGDNNEPICVVKMGHIYDAIPQEYYQVVVTCEDGQQRLFSQGYFGKLFEVIKEN